MKSGIDYFPLDVTLDEKFELIEAQFGLKGFAVMIKLLQKIYGGEGYYAEWTTEIALLFAKRIGANGSAVSDIVSAAIKRGIFDKTLYDKYQILTSSGIQKRYFEAVSRRKNVKVKREYLLFDATDFLKNVEVFQENVDIFPKNADISQQSKVKESKGKYIPPSARDTREEESSLSENEDDDKTINVGLRDFLKKHKNIVVDNCFNSNLSMMDYDLLDFRFSESEYLSENIHDLSWVAKNYHRIIAGEYKTKPTQGTVRRTKQNEGGISAQIDRILKKFAEEDKLNGIDET